MELKCPRCHSPLSNDSLEEFKQNISASTIGVDECKECRGIWFDKGELEKVHDIIDVTFIEIRKIPSKEEQYLPLTCPKCTNIVMEKVQNTRDKKVIMDVCPNCKGVWLDGGELKAIQEENLFLTLFNTIKWLYEN